MATHRPLSEDHQRAGREQLSNGRAPRRVPDGNHAKYTVTGPASGAGIRLDVHGCSGFTKMPIRSIFLRETRREHLSGPPNSAPSPLQNTSPESSRDHASSIPLFSLRFFLVVYGTYLALGRWYKWQNIVLLFASYVFYGYWDTFFLSLLAFSTCVDFVAGLAIEGSRDPRRRKAYLALSMATNLVLLGFFKYFNFFAGSFADLLGAFGLVADPINAPHHFTGRDLILYVQIDELRDRYISGQVEGVAQYPRFRAVRIVLPATHRRTDRSREQASSPMLGAAQDNDR